MELLAQLMDIVSRVNTWPAALFGITLVVLGILIVMAFLSAFMFIMRKL